MKNKENIRALTEGAMFGAIYGVILLLIRFAFSSSDSIIYYVFPIPLAIYTLRKGIRSGALLTSVLALMSFLFVDPIHALTLIIPNYIIGYVLGIFHRYRKYKPLQFIGIFLLCLIADYLSIYAFQLITGTTYLSSMESELSFMSKFFPQISSDYFSKMIFLTLPMVLIIDSVVKTVFIYLLLKMLKKFYAKDEESYQLHKIIYSPWIATTFILVVLIQMPTIYYGFQIYNFFFRLLICAVMTIGFLLGMYIVFQAMFIVTMHFKLNDEYALGVVLSLIMLIIFPIGVIVGLAFNFMQPFIAKKV